MSAAVILAFVAFGLALYHGLLLDGWLREITRPSPDHELDGTGATCGISVVVPARNAANTLVPLLQDLHAQQHPKDHYEVLVVDDHSTDGTFALADGMGRNWPGLRVMPANGVGKKAAIAQAVEAARHDLVLLTDADARCGPRRLSAVAFHMVQRPYDLLLLPVRTVGGKGFWAWLQRKEQAALQGAALGSAAQGRPVLANGANLAFRRHAFMRVGGFQGDRWASGDDMFLLQRMRQHRLRVDVLTMPDAAVLVAPAEGWNGFLQQRLRWAGKMRAYRDAGGLFAALLAVFLPWIMLALTIITAQWAQIGQGLFYAGMLLVAAWGIWLVPIVRLVDAVERRYAGPEPAVRADGWWSTLPALLLFTLYAPVIAILSIFVRPIWKGRRI